MSNIEQRAGLLDPYFETVGVVKDAAARTEGSVMTDYSDEKRQINITTIDQLAEIDARHDVPDRDKFMARLALRDVVQTDGNTNSQKGVLRSGMILLDRIYNEFGDGSPVVAHIEKEGVTLYASRGVDDLKITDERHAASSLGGGERWLNVHYEKGVRVVANPMLDDMIHEGTEPRTIKMIGILNGKGGMHGNDPFHRMRNWDPAHPEYDPPITRLGTPEHPADVSRLIVTDSQRFSFRAAAELTGHSDWLTAERPSEAFREKLIHEFAYAYWDLLAFGEPFDEQTRRIMHMSRGKIGIEHRRNRKKSLVDYTTREQAAIHHGAGISIDQMVDATSEIVERKERKADTMRKEYRVMRAKRDFKAFFFGANE